MSQTETLLLVLVGFSLAAVMFLFIARALWRAGVRLGARRMRKQVPASVAELSSERDSLRGEYARLSQKLNARLDEARLHMAEQMAEVTRHRNRLAQMTVDLNDRDAELERQSLRVAALEEDLADKTARLAQAEGELNSGRDQLSRTAAELQQLRLRHSELELLLQQNLSPEGALPPAVHGEPSTADRLKLRIDQLAGLSQAIAAERSLIEQGETHVTLDPLLQEKLETVARETADLQMELARLDAAWATKLGETQASDGSLAEGKPRAVANVISLAQRIRALQKDLAR